MGASNEQSSWRDRGVYPIHTAADLDDHERGLLARYGHWLEALATGVLVPHTAEQRRFVLVAGGAAEPRSAFERAWNKHRAVVGSNSHRVTAMEVAERLEQLTTARAAATAVRGELEQRRAAVMAQVQPQLAVIDAEFADRLREADELTSHLEADVRATVLAYGASYRHAGVCAQYYKPRVTWDGKGLSQYVESHPDVAQFRRVGKPTVALRFEKGGEAP